MTVTTGGWIFLIAMAGVVILVIVMYNRLVSVRQQSRAAWSDIDAQL